MYDDTIAAISTSVGEAGIGVVRISGKNALPVLHRVFRRGGSRPSPSNPYPSKEDGRRDFESHRVYYGRILDTQTAEVIDEVLAFCMLAPHSYTKEDVVEIHCHGGPVPLQRVLLAVLRAGARMALPGEFTLRAYLNGRIDLAQAESVADIIRSKTDRGLALAMKGLSGQLSQRVRDIRQQLLRQLAYLEATIDFSEDDIPYEDVESPIEGCLETVNEMLATADQGIMSKQGLRVAIVGRPNVGKSSLLNALLKSDRAIVTDIAGTTRDTLEEMANFSGVPVCLIDTAGIAESEDLVEQLGVERSRRAIKEADLCLLVVDCSVPIQPSDLEIAAMVSGMAVVVVANKVDLPRAITSEELEKLAPGAPVVTASTLLGEGLELLQQEILKLVFSGRVAPNDELLVSNPRHKEILGRVATHLEDALGSLRSGLPADCTTSDLRSAVDALGEITGETATEDLLDTIFSNFCIGK
jgi:tRNA modification GTPase